MYTSIFTLAVHFRFVYWLQFHEKFGPIVINFSRVINDISTIAITYLIFILGFSLGLMFLLNEGHYKISFSSEKGMNSFCMPGR